MPKGIKQTHIHLITDIDPFLKKGTCKACGRVHLIKRYRTGGWKGEWACSNKHYEARNYYRRRWHKTAAGRAYLVKERIRVSKSHRLYVKPICERCGFIPKHICQIDIHHKDGNYLNNDPKNLASICSNCHRLEHVKDALFLTQEPEFQI